MSSRCKKAGKPRPDFVSGVEYCMVNNILNAEFFARSAARRKANHLHSLDSQKPAKVNPEKMAVVFSDGRCTL